MAAGGSGAPRCPRDAELNAGASGIRPEGRCAGSLALAFSRATRKVFTSPTNFSPNAFAASTISSPADCPPEDVDKPAEALAPAPALPAAPAPELASPSANAGRTCAGPKYRVCTDSGGNLGWCSACTRTSEASCTTSSPGWTCPSRMRKTFETWNCRSSWWDNWWFNSPLNASVLTVQMTSKTSARGRGMSKCTVTLPWPPPSSATASKSEVGSLAFCPEPATGSARTSWRKLLPGRAQAAPERKDTSTV
mmetsp:Transcript_11415/g.32438  ORF Transcript_11415/g.32438 Transcript_11415/m.32438 type:complete len:251 (-) Transcript_11415:244-996(-)